MSEVKRKSPGFLFPRLGRPSLWISAIVFGLSCALGSVAAAQSLGLGGGEEAPEEEEYEIKVVVGFADYQSALKPGFWYPVWITLKSLRKDIDADLTLFQGEGRLHTTLAMEVPKGTTKRAKTYFKLREFANTLQVTLRVAGIGTETFSVPLREAPSDSHQVLILSDEPGAFGFLRPRSSADDVGGRDPLGQYTPIFGDPTFLTDDAIALESLDAIVIATGDVRSIDKDSWEAIRTWVAFGGRLLLAGGIHQPSIAGSVLNDPFGIGLNPPAPMNWRDILPGTHISGGESGEADARVLAALPSADAVWDRVLVGPGDAPLIVGKQHGRGWFHYCAVNLDSASLRAINAWPESRWIWPVVLQRPPEETDLRHLADHAQSPIVRLLQAPFTFELTGMGWVALFLGVYILCAVPLNWWVCRRIKRPDWTWPIAILIALAFTLYGYQSGVQTRQKDFVLNELTLIRNSTVSGTALATTFSSLFAPRRFSTTFEIPTRVFPGYVDMERTLWTARGVRNAPLRFQEPLSVAFGRRTEVDGLFLHPWSVGDLRADFSFQSPGAVELIAPIRMTAKTIEGRIANNTPYAFVRWWITDGRRFWATDDTLEPGGEASLSSLRALAATVKPVGLMGFSVADSLYPENAMNPAESDRFGRVERFQYMDASWRTAAGAIRGERFLRFVGVAEGSRSPLMEQLRATDGRRVTLYEQSLESRGVNVSSADREWRIDFVDAARGRASMQGIGYYRFPQVAPFPIPLFVEELRFVPSEPISIDKRKSLTIDVGFRIGDFKERPRPYYPRNGDGAPFLLVGCPISFYDYTKGRWTDPIDWPYWTRMTLAAFDYLHPVTSAIAVRIDARPDSLLYAADEPKGQQKPLRTGADLYGTANGQAAGGRVSRIRANSRPTKVGVGDVSVFLKPDRPEIGAGPQSPTADAEGEPNE